MEPPRASRHLASTSHLLETRVFVRDQSVRGLLRMTLAPTLATHLLMPDFADFARLPLRLRQSSSHAEFGCSPAGRGPRRAAFACAPVKCAGGVAILTCSAWIRRRRFGYPIS